MLYLSIGEGNEVAKDFPAALFSLSGVRPSKQCGNVNGQYVCTRPPHDDDGPHVTHAANGSAVAIWNPLPDLGRSLPVERRLDHQESSEMPPRRGGKREAMISKAEAKDLIDDLFEEEALVIAGMVAIHEMDDDLVWRLVKHLDVIRGKVLRRLEDKAPADEDAVPLPPTVDPGRERSNHD